MSEKTRLTLGEILIFMFAIVVFFALAGFVGLAFYAKEGSITAIVIITVVLTIAVSSVGNFWGVVGNMVRDYSQSVSTRPQYDHQAVRVNGELMGQIAKLVATIESMERTNTSQRNLPLSPPDGDTILLPNHIFDDLDKPIRDRILG